MNTSTALNIDNSSEVIAALKVERRLAEATLGRPLIDPPLFGLNCSRHGLGHALNVEQDLIP